MSYNLTWKLYCQLLNWKISGMIEESKCIFIHKKKSRNVLQYINNVKNFF